MNSRFSTRTGVIAVSVAALALAGCANSEKDSDAKVDTATGVAAPSTTAAAAAESSAVVAGDSVTLVDGFVKAKPADKSMTAIFGELENPTSAAVHVVGFTTSLGEASYEIHEVVDGKMQEKADGITIPAGGTYTLKPGSDHFMIMGYDKPIEAGDSVDLTLKFEDGTTASISDVPVRTIAAGQEDYGAHGGVEGNSGMTEANHADHDHAGHDHKH